MKTVFVDGQEGTTGLQIYDRLKDRDDIELLEIPNEKRKDIPTKTEYLNQADLVILCLPDDAARESVSLIRNPQTKVIDASTAHRTAKGWVYGLPELKASQREAIRSSERVANTGCYAAAFILLSYPLISQGIMPVDYPAVVHGASGYSGGGKKLIGVYENPDNDEPASFSYRPYALDLTHKHLPEMQRWTGLIQPPLLFPSVGNFYNGMLVSVPLISKSLDKQVAAKDVWELLYAYYESESFIRVMPFKSDEFLDNGFLSPTTCNGTNRVDVFVFGHEQQILLVARLDNLGKGASGGAVQNMNIMLDIDERKSLL